ncbi:MAG TPA: alcohol dehydrogenase catalytic domain-containing protein [Pyrinomonadaceae bacterium]|jgi:threonine dehydrogenase-like Zn-dependent dehydrogenase|nr:alcohol dehydrogenase catalytic domain-containing protein [Pyrinomonadaceae bacterium]
MNALRYENGSLFIGDVPKPLADGEAVVRVTLSGVCNTDLEIARGYAGFEGTLGHEFVGVIEEVGAQASLPADHRHPAGHTVPGTRVVGEINAGCGTCDLCRAGDPRHCPNRTVLGIVGRDGAHAEFLKLPVANLLQVPDEVSDECAVFTEPLAAACGILERVSITEDTRVAVIGDGKLGLLCAQVIATTGAKVTLVGKHENKLRIAARRGVETITVNEAGKRPSQFDVTVEASGSSSGFALAQQLLQPRGILVLKSTFHGKTEIDAAPLVVNEISVVGSRCGRFAPALELLKNGVVDVESLVDDLFPLTSGVTAMQRASQPGVLKILLRP